MLQIMCSGTVEYLSASYGFLV